ncbi:DUF6597 domain-containing transcriptional factor [Streptomyces cathayae]|uniref:DUF6597 domain-containing transcriptional factor n=1 Tax=Streptomyces cathayae TaxID=3031124 RepID=UPI003C6F432C
MDQHTAGSGAGRVLPDGCLDLLRHDGRLPAAGPDTHAHRTGGDATRPRAGIRFHPGTAPALLGVPAHELRARRPGLGVPLFLGPLGESEPEPSMEGDGDAHVRRRPTRWHHIVHSRGHRGRAPAPGPEGIGHGRPVRRPGQPEAAGPDPKRPRDASMSPR